MVWGADIGEALFTSTMNRIVWEIQTGLQGKSTLVRKQKHCEDKKKERKKETENRCGEMSRGKKSKTSHLRVLGCWTRAGCIWGHPKFLEPSLIKLQGEQPGLGDKYSVLVCACICIVIILSQPLLYLQGTCALSACTATVPIGNVSVSPLLFLLCAASTEGHFHLIIPVPKQSMGPRWMVRALKANKNHHSTSLFFTHRKAT